ncbi:MAG TPA: HAD hydrolase family protein [Gemmatimonadaceae bacterium]|jgi:3-deoxy-D-manno-octulosonate 8-phosphate phosphatase (KDO 8-P phosphatase)
MSHVIASALAKRIKLVGLDVDGVLTDGGIYLGDVGGMAQEFKRYDIQDGLGIRLLRASGMKVVIITGRVSESVRLRATELEIDDLIQDGQARKLSALQRILERFSISLEDTAFVGDDFPDDPVLRAVGLPVAVGNAVPEIRALCKVQLTRTGGFGAVREFSELLLKARGDWDRVVSDYLAERIDTKLEVLR